MSRNFLQTSIKSGFGALAIGSLLMLAQPAAAQSTLSAPTLTGESLFCQSKIDLAWNVISGAQSYAIYRKSGLSSSVPYSLIKMVSSDQTGYFDNYAGNPAHDYTSWKVAACNASGCGAQSNAVGTQYYSPCQ